MKKLPSIFITGSTGFVGSNLLSFFKKKAKITCYKKKSNLIINENIVIHLAGKAHDLGNVHNVQEYYEVNTDLTKKVFESFLSSEANIFITLSSVKAVADSVKGVLTENCTPNPKTHYGKSKLLAEQYILSQHLPKDKRVYVLRPCMIHGPGNKGNLNLLFKLVSKGIPWPLGSFNNKRSFCSINNLLFVINELINNKNIPSGVYNVADDQTLSTNEIISLINKTQNKKPIIWNVSKNIIYLLAKVGDKINLPLNSEKLKKLTESYLVSNKKLIDSLGKTFPEKSQDGMIKTFESFKLN
jgi:nucleoside-diphosphate-sugar epimerase